MQDFVKVMKAFSEPNRVKIVKLLQHRSMCVEELRSVLGIAQPTVSNHLKVLSFAGLVACSRKGFWVYYYPSDGSSSPFAASMLGNLKHWLEDDEEFLKFMDRTSSINGENTGSAGGRQMAFMEKEKSKRCAT